MFMFKISRRPTIIKLPKLAIRKKTEYQNVTKELILCFFTLLKIQMGKTMKICEYNEGQEMTKKIKAANLWNYVR